MAKSRDPRFPHFMLQEINEQPAALQECIDHYFAPQFAAQTAADFRFREAEVRAFRRIRIIASGSSRFAGMFGEFVLERFGGIPVEVDYSSQYCYRAPLAESGELVVLLTQSGTTADTLAAQRVARDCGARNLVICNVADAPITKLADGVIYTHAGEELAIAATKSFTAQMAALLALSIYFAELKGGAQSAAVMQLRRELLALPEIAQPLIEQCAPICRAVAEKLSTKHAFMVLGRDASFPVALEAALKLKETSYVFAEAFPTGEVKHGPSALLDKHVPVLMIMTRSPEDLLSQQRFERSLAQYEAIAQQECPILAVMTEGDTALLRHPPLAVCEVPRLSPSVSPVLEVMPLQLFAYYLAAAKGLDVDRPRNLTKSVLAE